ncbi:PREDICTED: uncharacterized protein LOC104807179 [Tarenaya hassleriana]|uniref:uncharacterized protein LOC104807179 n=1 Tax=Tarenaya hassleriana TaxID=28532 RepID=UPI00053C8112|nr:PREDICTED: uncharacterized protein LOC104807179 [Tarenaya hassleriana]
MASEKSLKGVEISHGGSVSRGVVAETRKNADSKELTDQDSTDQEHEQDEEILEDSKSREFAQSALENEESSDMESQLRDLKELGIKVEELENDHKQLRQVLLELQETTAKLRDRIIKIMDYHEQHTMNSEDSRSLGSAQNKLDSEMTFSLDSLFAMIRLKDLEDEHEKLGEKSENLMQELKLLRETTATLEEVTKEQLDQLGDQHGLQAIAHMIEMRTGHEDVNANHRDRKER